jgi:hypothetical protein
VIIQFTLENLMLFLLCALGITAGLLIIPILWSIKKMTGILRPLIENNQDMAKKALKSMPEFLENVGYIGSNSREVTNQLRLSVPVLIKEVGDLAGAAKGGIEVAGVVLEKMGSGFNDTVASYKDTTESTPENATGFMAYVPLIKEILQVIDHTFASEKQ